MTMKLPIDHEATITPAPKDAPRRVGPMMAPKRDVPSYDPAKRFRFTWPGQPPRIVSGDELSAICHGADAAMLSIEEVGGAPTPPATLPGLDSDESTQGRLARIKEESRK
jgi:hypothetical protein